MPQERGSVKRGIDFRSLDSGLTPLISACSSSTITRRQTPLGAHSWSVCPASTLMISPALGTYLRAKSGLQDSFAFREWHEGEPSIDYLGAEVESRQDVSKFCHQKKYLSKLHPITIERLADLTSPVTEKERTRRPSMGCHPNGTSCSASHLDPRWPNLEGHRQQAANKALRFAKENDDVGLHYQWIGDLDDLVVIGYSDASFACREDLSSQGGYLITLVHRDMVQKGIPGPYHVLDWRSFKLPRVARGTLSADGQAAAEAADVIYFTSLFINGCLDPGLDLSPRMLPGSSMSRHWSSMPRRRMTSWSKMSCRPSLAPRSARQSR